MIKILYLLMIFSMTLKAGVSHLTAFGIHTCALNDANKLYCWGQNESAQLGLGTKSLSKVPTQVQGLFLNVFNSRFHSCAIQMDGSLKCWGLNSSGQLGLGVADLVVGAKPTETVDKLPTLKLGSEFKVKQVGLGLNHTCAVFENGSLKCWGKNMNGELGLGISAQKVGTLPTEMGSDLKTVSLGDNQKVAETALGEGFTCARFESGDVKCWGRAESIGSEKEVDLGKSTTDMGNNLRPLDLGQKAVRITAGQRFVCALLSTGNIKCWGRNDGGVLGVGEKNLLYVAGDAPGEMGNNLREVALGGIQAEDLSCGHSHCCAILKNHGLKCWGSNSEGQLGLGDKLDRGTDLNQMGQELPYVNLGPFANVQKISLGSVHTCALLGDKQLRCWGRNSYGQLGNENFASFGTSPEEMGESLPIVQIP